ncbi:aldo/keto reductase [Streptomyces sp. NBC_01808]|uniref:aldo/keto reductase n=1 Tax=Streptomyces sp. NBC_01808 TaxID=2975947 RepID=UPI002DDAFCE9|nr:aldo/keto reductase [Streptomyces sp. NBC_01808]WSA40322.1 aldo/keto reductase [Streptomyces sp. NBC_01808]
MRTRLLPRADRKLSVVGLGTWQFGDGWSHVGERDVRGILDAAVASGVDFIDTADVYGDGRSERLIGRFLKDFRTSPGERPTVATKFGRRGPQEPGSFTLDNFREWSDRSRANLGMDTLDLVQLHTPPDAVFASDAVFDALDALVEEGRMKAYGVSVETCAQAMTALARPGVASVQIILNVFRRKPLEEVLPAAKAAGVGIIARVPLASGLLSAKFRPETVFAEDDHRTYNRHGEQFDVGETFSGVDYETGLAAAAEFAALVPEGMTAAQLALRWVVQQDGVTTVIPGATSVGQARDNAAVGSMAPLPATTAERLRELYDRRIRGLVHHRW